MNDYEMQNYVDYRAERLQTELNHDRLVAQLPRAPKGKGKPSLLRRAFNLLSAL